MAIQNVPEPQPSRQDYIAVDDAFENAAYKIMHAFDGYEMIAYLDALENAMKPTHPKDQLSRILALVAEIETVQHA